MSNIFILSLVADAMAALAVLLLSCYDKFVRDPKEFAEQSVLQNSLAVQGFSLFCTFAEPHQQIDKLADAFIFLPFRGPIQRYRIGSVFKKVEDDHAAFLFYNALTTVREVHPAYLVAIFEGEQNDQFRCVVNRQMWHGEGSEYSHWAEFPSNTMTLSTRPMLFMGVMRRGSDECSTMRFSRAS